MISTSWSLFSASGLKAPALEPGFPLLPATSLSFFQRSLRSVASECQSCQGEWERLLSFSSSTPTPVRRPSPLHGQVSVLVCFPHLLRTAGRVISILWFPVYSRLGWAGARLQCLGEPCLQRISKPTYFEAKELYGITGVGVWMYISQMTRDWSSCKYIVMLIVKNDVLYSPRHRSGSFTVSTALAHLSPSFFKALSPLFLLV